MVVTVTSSNSSLSPHQVNAYHLILRNEDGDENTRRDTKILRNFVPRFHGVEIMEVDGEGMLSYSFDISGYSNWERDLRRSSSCSLSGKVDLLPVNQVVIRVEEREIQQMSSEGER